MVPLLGVTCYMNLTAIMKVTFPLTIMVEGFTYTKLYRPIDSTEPFCEVTVPVLDGSTFHRASCLFDMIIAEFVISGL